MTAQEDQWIRLIKNRLDCIIAANSKPAIIEQADIAFVEVEKLETLLKGKT